MTIQQKLDIFSKRVNYNVDATRRQEAKEIQEAIIAAVNAAENEAQLQSNEQLKTERARLERESNKLIYAATSSARQKIAALKEQLIAELLITLENDLHAFVKSPEYKSFLLKGLESVDTQGFSKIILMPDDLANVQNILTLEASNEDFIGGFKLISADERVLADYSLLAKLGELSYEDFWD